MIDVKNVTLVIDRKKILDDISLRVENGKILGLIGRNGSGKTMLMKVICGLILPTAGEVTVDGKRIGVDTDFPENTGIIIETPGFIPYKSGYWNLKNLADLNGRVGKKEIKSAMERVGLNPELKLSVAKYSLGMRQRLGLAQAIMENPDTLILDEPFNGLDMDGVRDMRGFLLGLKSAGKTILISSHNAEDISILCDEVRMMDKGHFINP